MKFWLPFSLFALLIIVFSINLKQDPGKLPSMRLSQAFPSFSLPSLANAQQPLSEVDLLGDVTLVNVWGSWCVSCRIEHGVLMTLAKTHNVRIVGINYKDERDKALQWLATLGNPYVFNIYDPDGRLPIDLGVYGTPETFLLDKNAIIVHHHAGPINPEDWQTTILPIINQISNSETVHEDP